MNISSTNHSSGGKMAERNDGKPVFLHRSVLFDGLKALLLMHKGYEGIISESQFSQGYQQGYRDALLSLGSLCGMPIDEEIRLSIEERSQRLTRIGSLLLNSNNRAQEYE